MDGINKLLALSARMKPAEDILVRKIRVGNIPVLILRPRRSGSLKGVRRSFIPLAYSFYAFTAHWWTDTQGSLEAAVEEMPAGYADKMLPVINNTPGLIIALILVIPVAVIGMRLAEKVLKKQAASLS